MNKLTTRQEIENDIERILSKWAKPTQDKLPCCHVGTPWHYCRKQSCYLVEDRPYCSFHARLKAGRLEERSEKEVTKK